MRESGISSFSVLLCSWNSENFFQTKRGEGISDWCFFQCFLCPGCLDQTFHISGQLFSKGFWPKANPEIPKRPCQKFLFECVQNSSLCFSDETADELASGTSTFGRGGKGRSHLTVVSTTRSLAARWKGRTQASTNLTCESPQQEITYVPTSVLKGGETTTDQELQVVRNILLPLVSPVIFPFFLLSAANCLGQDHLFLLVLHLHHTPWARPRRGIQRRLRYPQKHRNPNSNRLEIPFTQPNSRSLRITPSVIVEVPLRGCRQRQ